MNPTPASTGPVVDAGPLQGFNGTGEVVVSPSWAAQRLPLPHLVNLRKIFWRYALDIVAVHVLALLAFVPWLFSWTGFIVMLVAVPLVGGLGINLCYHRLLAHRSLKVPKWLERFFVVIAVCSMQDTPARWVANHRLHHNHADEQEDPHSPLVTFFWSHIGWLFIKNPAVNSRAASQKFAKDVLQDPFYLRLEKTFLGAGIYALHAVLFFAVGFLIGWAVGGWAEAVRMGLSLLLWCVIVRTVVVWHFTWSVNSLTHLLGYRSYDTPENSRNNWFVAIIALGEGWHNNHHHDPVSATVRHRWWEIDLTYCVIKLLEWVGLATDVVPPKYLRRLSRSTPPQN